MYRTEQDALNALVAEQKKANELLQELILVLKPKPKKEPVKKTVSKERVKESGSNK